MRNRSGSIDSTPPSRRAPDFSGGVRGKYAEALKDGYSILVHHDDGDDEQFVVRCQRPGFPLTDPSDVTKGPMESG